MRPDHNLSTDNDEYARQVNTVVPAGWGGSWKLVYYALNAQNGSSLAPVGILWEVREGKAVGEVARDCSRYLVTS